MSNDELFNDAEEYKEGGFTHFRWKDGSGLRWNKSISGWDIVRKDKSIVIAKKSCFASECARWLYEQGEGPAYNPTLKSEEGQPQEAPHSGNKYRRTIKSYDKKTSCVVDIYSILDDYPTTAAVSHAVKKLLMAGQRGDKGYEQDLREAIDAIKAELGNV